MENQEISPDVDQTEKRLRSAVKSTFTGMRSIFLVMKEYNIPVEDMCTYIAEIAGNDTNGSTIDMHVYDSIVAAIEIVYAHILEK